MSTLLFGCNDANLSAADFAAFCAPANIDSGVSFGTSCFIASSFLNKLDYLWLKVFFFVF